MHCSIRTATKQWTSTTIMKTFQPTTNRRENAPHTHNTEKRGDWKPVQAGTKARLLLKHLPFKRIGFAVSLAKTGKAVGQWYCRGGYTTNIHTHPCKDLQSGSTKQEAKPRSKTPKGHFNQMILTSGHLISMTPRTCSCCGTTLNSCRG